jgi:hypothetical protein
MKRPSEDITIPPARSSAGTPAQPARRPPASATQPAVPRIWVSAPVARSRVKAVTASDSRAVT